jgi:Phage tail assembly chaperone
MAKIKLGARPKTFKHKVEVALPEGGKGAVEIVYKYRTRTEFGVFIDELFSAARVDLPSLDSDDVTLSLAEALAKTRDTNADYILAIAEGWDLEAEFERAAVAQLCDELPGVALAIINTYRLACTEGRLGN